MFVFIDIQASAECFPRRPFFFIDILALFAQFKVIATVVARAGNDILSASEERAGSHQRGPFGHGGASLHDLLGYHIEHS